jgi:hypothetical protein
MTTIGVFFPAVYPACPECPAPLDNAEDSATLSGMAGLQLIEPIDVDSLHKELDIFTRGQAPPPELIEKGLHPPLPICAGALIWGFNILRSAMSRSLGKLSCLMIPGLSREQMLALALKLENRAGGYGWMEKERMLGFLAASGSASAGLSSGRAAAPQATAAVQGTFDLAAPCERLSPLIEGRRDPRLKSLVDQGGLDLKTACRVRSLPEQVFRRVGAAPLSFSRSRRFLSELFEIGRRDGLSGPEMADLAEQALRDRLPLEQVHRLRFPVSSGLEERFSALERELLKGSGVRLKPPPYFEGEAFVVEFEFDSAGTLGRRLAALHRLEGRLDALLELLR